MTRNTLRQAVCTALFATVAGTSAAAMAAPEAADQDVLADTQAATATSSGSPEADSTQASAGEVTLTELEQVTVTGSRIRGGSTPSPVITIGSERIREEGFSDLGEVIRSLPQNFGGGQNPGVIPFTVSGAGAQNTNLSGGSALNLRGLGADATLTLLNGRRMAYDGISQAVDISAIPVEAV